MDLSGRWAFVPVLALVCSAGGAFGCRRAVEPSRSPDLLSAPTPLVEKPDLAVVKLDAGAVPTSHEKAARPLPADEHAARPLEGPYPSRTALCAALKKQQVKVGEQQFFERIDTCCEERCDFVCEDQLLVRLTRGLPPAISEVRVFVSAALDHAAPESMYCAYLNVAVRSGGQWYATLAQADFCQGTFSDGALQLTSSKVEKVGPDEAPLLVLRILGTKENRWPYDHARASLEREGLLVIGACAAGTPSAIGQIVVYDHYENSGGVRWGDEPPVCREEGSDWRFAGGALVLTKPARKNRACEASKKRGRLIEQRYSLAMP